MPEQPEPKHLTFHLPPTPPTRGVAPAIPYAELHCATNFSFLEGASHGEELAAQAAALGYAALAITDRNSLAGVVRVGSGLPVTIQDVGARGVVHFFRANCRRHIFGQIDGNVAG
jgi:hypothetical protein